MPQGPPTSRRREWCSNSPAIAAPATDSVGSRPSCGITWRRSSNGSREPSRSSLVQAHASNIRGRGRAAKSAGLLGIWRSPGSSARVATGHLRLHVRLGPVRQVRRRVPVVAVSGAELAPRSRGEVRCASPTAVSVPFDGLGERARRPRAAGARNRVVPLRARGSSTSSRLQPRGPRARPR